MQKIDTLNIMTLYKYFGSRSIDKIERLLSTLPDANQLETYKSLNKLRDFFSNYLSFEFPSLLERTPEIDGRNLTQLQITIIQEFGLESNEFKCINHLIKMHEAIETFYAEMMILSKNLIESMK